MQKPHRIQKLIHPIKRHYCGQVHDLFMSMGFGWQTLLERDNPFTVALEKLGDPDEIARSSAAGMLVLLSAVL